MAVQLGLDMTEAQKHRLEQINELDEIRKDAVQRINIVQQQRIIWYDKYIKEKKFQEGAGHSFLTQNSRIFKGNFRLNSLGHIRLRKSLKMEQ